MFRILAHRSTFAMYFSLLAAASAATAQEQFKLPCAQPQYPSPASSSLMIDAQCVVQGAGSEVKSNPAEGAQNKGKNNFCAQENAGAIKTADMKALQDKVQQDPSINFGKSGGHAGPTTDRSKLSNLGKLSEGKVVVFTGYVLSVSQEGAESVNCELGKPPQGAKTAKKSNPAVDALHDIHIQLVDSKGITNKCQSFVAEMSPHHRPAEWNHDNVDKVLSQKLQVRVTGQLFFDSSHDLPCVGGNPSGNSGGNPIRIALWEIHPIYQFEVCPTGTCATSGWKSLSDWVDGK
jgi:hypothetical protein